MASNTEPSALTIPKLSAALPALKARFDAVLPTMTNRAHLKPCFVNAHLFPPPPEPLYEEFLAMLHVSVQETLLKPLETGLRYLIRADGFVVRQRALVKDYYSSDAATPYMSIVEEWVDSVKGQ